MGYSFRTFEELLNKPSQGTVVLRHDVDKSPLNSLNFAHIQKDLGFHCTYYFRIVSESFQPKIMEEIASLGHEIGYHYEDLTLCKGNKEKAIISFRENLEKMRDIYPIKTICMHGSPLSKYDNKSLWNDYNYRSYGIIGDAYLDTDFSRVLYLTDTGRRWNGSNIAVRDKVNSPYNYTFHTTFDIIRSIHKLPDRIMITIHPQRWNDKWWPWTKELLLQNIKNTVKYFLIKNKNIKNS
jgi:hypothetical protein